MATLDPKHVLVVLLNFERNTFVHQPALSCRDREINSIFAKAARDTYFDRAYHMYLLFSIRLV